MTHLCDSENRWNLRRCYGHVALGSILAWTGCSPAPTTAPPPPTVGESQAVEGQNAAPSAERRRRPRSPEMAALLDSGAELQREEHTGVIIAADLSKSEVTDELAKSLATQTEIKKLTLRQSVMTVDGWNSLAKLEQVEQLDLRDCPLNNEQLTILVKAMPRLRALRLSGKTGSTEVDDAGLEAVAQCPDLKVLAVDHLWISVDGLQHLSNSKNLSELYLAGTLVDDAAMALLASHTSLRKLRLAKTSVGTAGLESLSSLPLEELDISECSQVLDDAMLPVGRITSLKRLNLWRNSISDAGVAHLAGLTNLTWLNLDNTHMGNSGLQYLQSMSKLTFLHLGSTAVSNEGMPQLVALKALKELKVTRTAVTEEGLEQILAAIPGVDVQLKYIEAE